jgi:hypothetical protein
MNNWTSLLGTIVGVLMVLVAVAYAAINDMLQQRKIRKLEHESKEFFDTANREIAALQGQLSQQYEQIVEAQRLSLEYKQINKFLAASYPHEIASGAHDHFKTTADVVIHYLKKERTTAGWGQPQHQQVTSAPLS